MTKQTSIVTRLRTRIKGDHWINLPCHGDRYFESLKSEVRKVWKIQFYHK